jgi:hypothetical protein
VHPFGRLGRIAMIIVAFALAAACTAQFVAPYNADLQQKASSMQAEVASWDLTMRHGAGTVADDPRNPDVIATLNHWRGEADAMLTLAISNDPKAVDCNPAAESVRGLIESNIPADLRTNIFSAKNTGTTTGCEATLVAGIDGNIDSIELALRRCRADWVPDTYFMALSQNGTSAPKPTATTEAKQDSLTRSCESEFKPTPGAPANAAEARHGRAVSALLTTLQVIVYVENRKKAAATAK